MQTKNKSFVKSENIKNLFEYSWQAENLFSADGSEWKRHRDLLNPSFSDQSLSEIFKKSILPQRQVLLDVISKEKHVNITNLFKFFTFDIISNAGFGYDTKALKNNDGRRLLENESLIKDGNILGIFPYALWPIFKYISFGRLKVFMKNLKSWKSFLNEIADEKTEQDAPDILTRMRNAVHEGDRLTKPELIANSNVLLTAGHETTANTLIRYLYYIGTSNPEIQKKLQDEADSFAHVDNSWDEYANHFVFTRNCMYEVLRLHSPAHIMVRQIAEDVELAGVTVPSGAVVLTMDFIGCRDPSVWGHDAQEFKPERFQGKDIRKMNFFPFSVGPRACIGKLMAEQEIICAISAIMKNYDIKIDEKKFAEYKEDKFELTRKPKCDLFVDFVPRRQ